MKKLVALVVFLIAVTTATMAQAPQAFAFQSSVTDTLGNPLSNKAISVQFDVRSGSASGTVVYSENQSMTTTQTGYFSANVGQGTVGSGSFSGISWGTNTYWLEVSVDTTGGTSYISLGASQLLSVPYALHADTATYVQNASTPSMFYHGSGPATYSGSIITILFTEDIDRGGAYDPATGIYTVQKDGIYQIYCFNATSSSTNNYNLNGTVVGFGFSYNKILQLVIGDTFSVESTDYNTDSYLKIQEIK